MQFTDAAPLAGTRRTEAGYLIAEAAAVRTGIQLYRGDECGMDLDVVRVYRPEAEVRSADSLRSFSHAPVTIGHPANGVTADTWKDLAVGEVSTEAEWQDNRIRLPLILKDAAAIALVEGGVRELSAGYRCTLDRTPGITDAGEPYDAVQRNIVIDHLAIVPRGRAGAECRIGDAATWGARPLTEDKEGQMADSLKTMVLGDAAVQVAIADADKVEAWKAAQGAKLTALTADHDKALAAKDAEIATRDARIADLEKQVLSDAALDARVQARAALIAKAKALVADLDTVGKSDADIRKAVVIAKRGAGMADKSPAYLDAAFDLLAEDKAADPVRGAMKDAAPAGDVHDEQRRRLADAWKTPVKEG